MSWKWAAAPLLAALLIGRPTDAPSLRAAIPERAAVEGCDYTSAREAYLLAYAYAHELPPVAAKFLATADRELTLCNGEKGVLEGRLRELKASLP